MIYKIKGASDWATKIMARARRGRVRFPDVPTNPGLKISRLQDCAFGRQIEHALRAELRSHKIAVKELFGGYEATGRSLSRAYWDKAARDLIAGNRFETPLLSALLEHPAISVRYKKHGGGILYIFAAGINIMAAEPADNPLYPHVLSNRTRFHTDWGPPARGDMWSN